MMMATKDFNETPLIYTTGAYLRPLQLIDEQGNERWVWSVTEFDGDSFNDGTVFNPNEYAPSLQALMPKTRN